jgi:hypothetical protein
MNADSFCPVVLEEIEVGTPRFVQCHNFAVNDRVVRKISESFEDQGILSIEGISAPRLPAYACSERSLAAMTRNFPSSTFATLLSYPQRARLFTTSSLILLQTSA